MDLGPSVRHAKKVKAAEPIYQMPAEDSCEETQLDPSPPTILPPSFDTPAASRSSQVLQTPHRGATSDASSSAAPRAPGRLQRSTTHLDTPTFTLWQASYLYGSTATRRNVFSLLTTLRSRLMAKYSCESWMAILCAFQSREDLFWLDTIACAFAPTSGQMSRACRRLTFEDSALADSSGSEADEDNTMILSDSSETEGTAQMVTNLRRKNVSSRPLYSQDETSD